MKHVKFTFHDNEIKEGVIVEDEHFAGGYKVIHENCILALHLIKIIEELPSQPKEEKQYHFLYKTTSKFNDKFYIGVHSTFDLNDDYLGSGYRLLKDIKRFGKSQYEREILEFFDTKEQAYEREKEIVNETLMKNWYCLNVAEGGGKYKKGDKLHFKNFVNEEWNKITWHKLIKDDKTHSVVNELLEYFISLGWSKI